MKQNKHLLLLGAALLAAALAWVLLLPDHLGDDTVADAGAITRSMRWEVGSAQEYDVVVDSSSFIRLGGTDNRQTLTLRMDGVLEFTTLEVDSAGALAGMRLSSLAMVLAGQSPNAESSRELTLPFRVRFAANGRLMAIEFPAAMGADVREVIENLVRMFQVTIEEDDQWVGRELNASGLYDAAYTRISPSKVVKNKQRYINSAVLRSAIATEVTSTESIHIGSRRDWISSMTVDERLITKDANGPFSEVSNHATLKLRDVDNSFNAAAEIWNFDTAGAPALKKNVSEALLPSLSHEEAERDMRSSIATLDMSSDARSPSIHRLRDLLLMDGQLPLTLLETLRNEQLTDRTRADLYLALQLAGTPAAQAVLNSLVADTSLSAQDGLRAIVALGAVKNPTEETFENLWDTARSGSVEGDRRHLPATATLALGSLGNNLRSTEHADYSSLRADLLDGASTASNADQRAAFLLALGNTADDDPSTRSDIVPFLNDAAPEVRSAAANSLGRLGTDQVADNLVQRFESEPSSLVRGSIAEALARWENPSPTAIEAFRTSIHSEPDEKARYNLALLLAKSMETFPENRAALEQLLDTEQSRRIRQQVANMLYPKP